MKNKIRTMLKILTSQKIFNILPDKTYLKIKYKLNVDKSLNLKEPETFNEKLQWLKLYDRKDIYSMMVDKYESKDFISKIIGKEYIIPTIGIYDSFEEIDFDKLPKQFVIKCTHDSGGVIVCKDKKKFDREMARKKINKCLKNNYFYLSREWPYKNVKPRVIVEKYLGENLIDYRFYCFEGIPKYVYVYSNESNINGDKPEPVHCDIYDMNWKRANYKQKCPPSNQNIEKPKNFKNMIELSKKLSKNCKFLRVDFYEINGKLYNGELTFFPGGGMSKFYPEKMDKELGKLINIKSVEKNEK